MMETFSLTNFTLMDPLLTQNDKIRLESHNFLHFVHNFFQYRHKLSLMYVFTPASKFKDSGFSCFNYFLFTNTGLEYFRRLSFKITFLGEPLEGYTRTILNQIRVNCGVDCIQNLQYYQQFIIYIPRNVQIRLKFAEFSFQLIQMVLQFIQNVVELSLILHYQGKHPYQIFFV